jgi:Tfp pilus assembly protein PilN
VSVDTKTRTIADLPHVNLLPPEIGERKRLQQVQLLGVVLLAVAVAAVGALYTTGKSDVSNAKKQVAAANAENATLTRSVATYAHVSAVKADKDAHEAMLIQAMATEIQWSNYLGAFATLPTSTWLEGLTLSETVQPGSLTSPTQAPAIVANISFQGTGVKSYLSLADFLDRVATLGGGGGTATGGGVGAQDGFISVYFSTAVEAFIDATKVVNFAASTAMTSTALSKRCVKAGDC